MGAFKNFKIGVAANIMESFRIGGSIAPKDKQFANDVIREMERVHNVAGVWKLVVEEYKVLEGSHLFDLLVEAVEEEGVE
jgi:hypothetical protein